MLLVFLSLVTQVKTYAADNCGVPDGTDNCVDCLGVPNGSAVRDKCGVCAGDGTSCIPCEESQKDECGVCFGTNSCLDCFGIPFGNAKYDQCDVCGGLDETCRDCFGLPNGFAVYDVCKVCGGDGTTCNDCEGTPAGTSKYDKCDVCNGDNACVDCFGEVYGLAAYDQCDVCDGNGKSCVDCKGIVNGDHVLNDCNQCVKKEHMFDKHGHKIHCIESILAEELESKMNLYVTLILVALLICFVLAIIFALQMGGAFSSIYWSVFDDLRATPPPARRGGGGGGGGGTVVFAVTVLALLGVVNGTQGQDLAVALCSDTNIGSIIGTGPGSCTSPSPDACSMIWSPLVTCETTGIIRRVTIDTYPTFTGLIPNLTLNLMHSALSISLRGGGTPEAPTLFIYNFGDFDFTQFTDLQIFRLANVEFTFVSSPATIGLPASISKLVKLQELSITDSNLRGGIIPEVCFLAQLQTLNLINDELSGPSFCVNSLALLNLKTLNLANNRLTGPLPNFSTNSKLIYITYDNNLLTGSINPATLPPGLYYFSAHHNRFTLIDDGWNSALNYFYASYNLFTGATPQVLQGAYYSDLSHNGYSSWNFANFICTYNYMDLSHNKLPSPVPIFTAGCFPYPPASCLFQDNLFCDDLSIHESFDLNHCEYTFAPTECCAISKPNCFDCAGVVRGTAVYDQCDICNGDGKTCVDCTGTLFGTVNYDVCGVCGGDDSTCRDCLGIPNGGHVFDLCDSCNGTSSTCPDCSGAPKGPYITDFCGNCTLPMYANRTCTDCAGVVNGTSRFDEYGVCNGHGRNHEIPLVEDLENSEGSFWWLLALFVASVVELCLLAFAFVTLARRLR